MKVVRPRSLDAMIYGMVSSTVARIVMLGTFVTLPLMAMAQSGVAQAEKREAKRRPNVLMIVSDDQGYNDLGSLGNGILTPHLDRLAREGTRLTHFYVTWPACTPSRGSILTGRYPQRNGISELIRNEAPDFGYQYPADEYAVTFERIGGMDTREVLLSQLFRDAGYRTAIFGKWDLGSLDRYLPTSRGFDEFYGFVNTGVDYYTHERYGVPSMYRNLSPTTEDRGTYCTDLFEREALRFLGDRNSNDPFFLYLPFNAPHSASSLDPKIRSTVQAPEEYKRMYPAVAQETRMDANYRYDPPATVATREARQRDYRAAVTKMDAAIGRVLDQLEASGELDETIIVFFSDNGGGGGADNSPLRGKKGQMWEGGIRVPCVVRWPAGGIAKNQVCDELLTSLELFPSLAHATDLSIPEGLVLDGYDWWQTLRGESSSPRTEMYWQKKSWVAARVGHWKWVDLGTQSGLYDLAQDPGERRDLSAQRPEVSERMRERVRAWQSQMEAADPRGPFRNY